MPSPPIPLTPFQEAEQARQVVNVLARIETRLSDGRWASGHRFGPDGGNCLIGAIDEAAGWAQPGVPSVPPVSWPIACPRRSVRSAR
jgi:hypothetical protein